MSTQSDRSDDHADDLSGNRFDSQGRGREDERSAHGTHETYETSGPTNLYLVVPAGKVELEAALEAAQVSETSVRVDPMNGARESDCRAADETVVSRKGDEIRVEVPDQERSPRRWGEIRVAVTLPEGSTLRATLASAELCARGALGDCSVKVASGAVRLETVGELDLRSASGEVTVERATGDAQISTASGDVRLKRADGEARINTASGEAEVGQVSGELGVNTASGDAKVRTLRDSGSIATMSGDVSVGAVEGAVRAKTVSGDIRIGVPGGAAAWLELNSLSGSIRSDLDEAEAPGNGERRVRIQANSTSGDITVGRDS